jgi:hypothetical protein
VPVSFPCHPSGAGKVALEGLRCVIGLAVRIDVQHDPRDFAPVGTFRIRIEHVHVGDGTLFIVGGERGIGNRRRLDRGAARGVLMWFVTMKPLRAVNER